MEHNEDRFILSEESKQALDQRISAPEEIIPPEWKRVIVAMPQDFFNIYEETLQAYKTLRETDKTFPAFEAMVMEARNSLEG